KLANDLVAIKKQLAQHAPYADVPRRNFQPRNRLPAPHTRLALEGPPVKVPVNATCEVEEPDDDEACEEFVEEFDDEAEELEGSRVNFFTTEGIDDYDEVVADMNSESFAVMTREQTKQREKVTQPPKKSKEQSATIPVIARRGSPIPTSSTQK
ncbi:hypothetical protein KI387_021575, partial [Taxus chinensis]